MKTVYLIHHSHLDIGYTHTISDIDNRYYHFLSNVIKYAKKDERFKYTIESYYTFESFLKRATNLQKEVIFKLIKKGQVDVTSSYLNFTDSLHPTIYNNLVNYAQEHANENFGSLKSAMFSDVNGFNPLYAQSLANNGVKYLMANVHSGHGIFPLERKLTPFWWKLPNGSKLLVYNSDLYTLGNEFGFVPKGSFSDVYDDEIDAKKYNYEKDEDNWIELSKYRFEKLFSHLEEVNHKFDFVAMGIHGTDDDNAIPNPYIIDRIEKWNELYGNEIEVKFVTLSNFFDEIVDKYDFDEYEGDWADWWSDGIGCQAEEFALFKKLQTEYLYYVDKVACDEKHEIEKTFALFAEHTFNHMCGVSNPYLYEGQLISYSKLSNVGKLVTMVNDLKYRFYDSNGCECYKVDITNKFKVINPANTVFNGIVDLKFDKFDLYTYPGPYVITDDKGNKYEYISQFIEEVRAPIIRINVVLGANEERIFTVENDESQKPLSIIEDAYKVNSPVGYERLPDIHQASLGSRLYSFDHPFIDEVSIRTNKYDIRHNKNGIYYIKDKVSGIEILNSTEGIGQPILEINKDTIKTNIESEVKNKFFRSSRVRKTILCNRYYGEVSYIDIVDDNKYYFIVMIVYTIENFSNYRIYLTINKSNNKIEIMVNATKNLIEKHHNLLIAQPFINSNNDHIFLDRGGYFLEAYKDNLPQSLTEYNTNHGGILIYRNDININITDVNTYLVHLKNVENNLAQLMHNDILDYVKKRVYFMPICHQWGVNFTAFKSNHLSLKYVIEWEEEINFETAKEKNKLNTLDLQVFKVEE